MIGKYLWPIGTILVAWVFIIVLTLFVWNTYKSTRGCESEINNVASVVRSIVSDCVHKCWSKHGYGKDAVADDCYLLYVNVTDRDLEGDELESGFIISNFEKISMGEPVELKVRYEPSIPAIVLEVVE